jgi:hypothetical protein
LMLIGRNLTAGKWAANSTLPSKEAQSITMTSPLADSCKCNDFKSVRSAAFALKFTITIELEILATLGILF